MWSIGIHYDRYIQWMASSALNLIGAKFWQRALAIEFYQSTIDHPHLVAAAGERLCIHFDVITWQIVHAVHNGPAAVIIVQAEGYEPGLGRIMQDPPEFFRSHGQSLT